MDFSELLNIAAQNQAAAQAEAANKRYGTTPSAPKKYSKSRVQSEAVRKFLAKKKCEEEQKALAEHRKKEQLLSLRFQNTKTGKKAKMMASRTKDNDFGQIKAGEVDEKTTTGVESPRGQMCGNAVDVSKNATAPTRQPAHINYEDLLKLASQKQQQPAKHTEVEVSNVRPMTKKQKALRAEEQARAQRRLQRQNTSPSQPLTAETSSTRNLQKKDEFRDGNRAPEQNKSRKVQGSDMAKNGSQVLARTSAPVPSRDLPGVRNGCSENKQLLKKIKNRDIGNAQDQTRFASPVVRAQNCKSEAPNRQTKGAGKISEQRREVFPKSVNLVQSVHAANKVITSENTKTPAGMSLEGKRKVVSDKGPLSAKLQMIKKPSVPQVKTSGNSDSKRRESKPFHMNPYMDDPLQVLEQGNIQKKSVKRRVETDDEDDMSDFIDDEPCEGDVNYSRYIKEMFRYDHSKFVDDDDDIMETTYAEQMKEEKRSAKLGYMEDLEDIRKEQEEKKRKMLKKKRL